MQIKREILFKKCRKYICFAILLVVVLAITINYNYNTQIYIIEWDLTNDIACHDQTYGDALPELGKDFESPEKSIFMHETSCRGGLNSRQACAVESAARAHPNWHVHVLFSGPVKDLIIKRSCLRILLGYNNVKLYRIHLKDYAKGTPAEPLVGSKSYEKSQWRVPHMSDVLRYLTLYKFGGVYMDSDVVVIKSFDTLVSNWAARENERSVDSGLMSFSKDDIGRKVAEAAIQDINKNYKPKEWGNNGPGVITRVVKAMCYGDNNKTWIQGCNGFKVYDPVVFYPVYYTKNKQYFEANRTLITSNRTYAHHMWNALTRKYDVPKSSPYAQLARQYCPRVYEAFGDKFGV